MSKQRTIHYAWIVAFNGALVLFSAIGLGRWAFTVLLPGMQAGLGWSFGQASAVSACNFIGYLLAVLFVPLLLHYFSARRVITAGLCMLGCALLVIGQLQQFFAIVLFFSLAGFGSGVCNIPMVSLIAPWFHADQRGKANGLVIAGNGCGMICAGLLIPLFSRMYGLQGWRIGWRSIGLIVIAMAILVGIFLRNDPSEMGLQPAGLEINRRESKSVKDPRLGSRALILLSVLYFSFGATSAVYGAFIVSSMIHEYRLTEQMAGSLWSLIGFLSILSGLGFGFLSDLFGRRSALCAVFATLTAAYLLVGLRMGTAALTASAVLFGISFFATPTLVPAALGDYFETRRVASALTIATLASAAGQVLGPIAAGAIAGPQGKFTAAYLAAALLSALTGLLALTLPRAPGGR